MGEGFGDNGLWTSLLTSSRLEGELKQGGKRICLNKKHEIIEKIISYDADKMEMLYEAMSGLPEMIKKATNHWSVKPVGANKSVVTTVATIDFVWWAKPLSPIISMGMNGVYNKIMHELTHYIETGNPHERKKAYDLKNAEYVPSLN